MRLLFRPYTLELRHAFNLSTSSRTSTPVVLTRIDHQGVSGYGEASMPPYLGESHETVTEFLSRIDLGPFKDPFRLEEILGYVQDSAPGNFAAKASVDLALHDLVGKLMGEPWHRIWGLSPERAPRTSFTIGMDTAEVVREKVREAAGFGLLKVKLGRDTDRMMIETIRSCTNVPLCVDVNQGWTDRHEALEMIQWLHEHDVRFVEQPMPRDRPDDNAWLTQHSPLPTIGDEAVQGPEDISGAFQVYSGINIKLMKCGGMREARRMVDVARTLGMKVMIGCMTETSCAVSAASQLSPLVDWADLDGNLLISNDVFRGAQLQEGRVIPPEGPGIGVEPLPGFPAFEG